MNGLLDTPLSPEQREYAEIARSSGQSLMGLINDILDFSKIEAGGLELESVDFDVQSVIDDTVDAVALRAAQKGLDFIVDDMDSWRADLVPGGSNPARADCVEPPGGNDVRVCRY